MIITVVAGFLLVSNFFLVLFLIIKYRKNPSRPDPVEWPMVSVLVAARNEGEKLPGCLGSLAGMDYPPDKIEFIIGDDQSEDKTATIIRDQSQEDPRFHYLSAIPEKNGLKAKSNVLAQLCEKAKGEIFLFTDADIEVNSDWAKSMVNSFGEGTGMVNGITGISGSGIWARLQSLEWLYAIGMLRVLTTVFRPVTGIGNNMAISSKTYKKIGGLESIPFSITEDHALFEAIHSQGYEVCQNSDQGSLVMSKAEPGLGSLLKQRKRWMRGASKLPFLIVLLLVIQAAKLAGIILLSITFWPLAALLFLIFFLMDWLFLKQVFRDIRLKLPLITVLLFPVYYGIVTPIVVLTHLWPSSVTWKGRKYS